MATSERWEVRGVGRELQRRAMAAAILREKRLGVWVTEALEAKLGEGFAEAEEPEKKVEEKDAPKKRRGGAARMKIGIPCCEHGRGRGFPCWQCGVLAKVEGKEDFPDGP
jgi:hypothetical protein